MFLSLKSIWLNFYFFRNYNHLRRDDMLQRLFEERVYWKTIRQDVEIFVCL